MSSTLKTLCVFAGGALVGAAATYFAVKTKFEKIANSEIQEMREFYIKREEIIEEEANKEIENIKNQVVEESQEEQSEPTEEELEEYRKQVEQYNHPEYTDALVRKRELQIKEQEEQTEMTEEFDKPYFIIKPDQMGETGYEPVTLTYYADGILCDELDNVIEEDEIEERIGMEALVNIGLYEPDIIHVRNEYLEIDYEIQEDVRSYGDIYGL